MWLAIALAVIWGGIFVAGSYRCSVRHRRRRGGAPPWSHQYDARGLGQDIAEAHAASRAAAIHRHRRYHVHGLDHGEIAERECGGGRSRQGLYAHRRRRHTWAWHRNPARSTAEVPKPLGMCADRVILRGVIKCFSKCGSCQN